MKATVGLGRWLGVLVGLHYSWFVIAWLITLSLTGRLASLTGRIAGVMEARAS